MSIKIIIIGNSGDVSNLTVGENNMAPFEEMSVIEKEELIVSLAALICADAKVEITVCRSFSLMMV